MAPPLVGLYPGSFDPITNGHTDVIKRASKICDRLVVGVAINTGKDPMFTIDERVEIVKEEIHAQDHNVALSQTHAQFIKNGNL